MPAKLLTSIGPTEALPQPVPAAHALRVLGRREPVSGLPQPGSKVRVTVEDTEGVTGEHDVEVAWWAPIQGGYDLLCYRPSEREESNDIFTVTLDRNLRVVEVDRVPVR